MSRSWSVYVTLRRLHPDAIPLLDLLAESGFMALERREDSVIACVRCPSLTVAERFAECCRSEGLPALVCRD